MIQWETSFLRVSGLNDEVVNTVDEGTGKLLSPKGAQWLWWELGPSENYGKIPGEVPVELGLKGWLLLGHAEVTENGT